MVNFFMFASETPNKSRAFGFAATKRRSTLVTTIASRELASNFRKSFSFVRSTSRNLRGRSATLLPSLASVFCANRRRTVTRSDTRKSCDLNVVILSFVTTIASRELASNFRKSFSLVRSISRNLRGLSATLLPSLVSVFCANRRCTVTRSDTRKSCDLNVVILSFVTTIASRELASNFRKSFSLVRSISRNLRGLSATLLPSLVSVFCANRRCTVTRSDTRKSCDLNVVILSFVTTIASRELASNFRKSFSLVRSISRNLRGLSATLLPSLVSVFCANRRCTVTCSDTRKSCDLNLMISIARAWRNAT